MASFTSFLNLLKKNPATDGKDTFNIETMLNENWDKIDLKVKDNSSAIGQIGSELNGKLNKQTEGIWTPKLYDAGGAEEFLYTSREGKFVKTGNSVHVSCEITCSSVNNMTNSNIYLGGLPYSSVDGLSVGSVVAYNFKTATKQISFAMQPTNFGRLFKAIDGSTSVLMGSDVENNFKIRMSCIYRIA